MKNVELLTLALLFITLVLIASATAGCAEGARFRVTWTPADRAALVNGALALPPNDAAPIEAEGGGYCLHLKAPAAESNTVFDVTIRADLLGGFSWSLKKDHAREVEVGSGGDSYRWRVDCEPGGGFAIGMVYP